MPNIFNVGFSKCGTSSLWQFFKSFEPTKESILFTDMDFDRTNVEFDLVSEVENGTLSDENLYKLKSNNSFGKFSSAIFDKSQSQKIHNILSEFGEPVYLISYRNPRESLISWYFMHKQFFLEGDRLDHPIVRDREKYNNFEFEIYVNYWIEKMNYYKFVKDFLKIVDGSKVYLINFNEVAQGTSKILGNFLNLYFPESQYDEVFATMNISNNKTPLVPSDEVSEILNKFNSRIQNYFDSLPEEGGFKLNNLFKHKNIYKA
jgi:hypothetical protein